MQALLSEVRTLHQDLRVSLNRAQSIQILLARFQMQEQAVARASDHFNDAHQKLLDTRVHQKELAAEVERLENSLNMAESQPQQTDLQDRIKRAKSNLEILGNLSQQQQTTEIQAGQQLREEQDKLTTIEGQMDELIRAMNNPGPPNQP